METPLVSVLIVTYNTIKYLDKSIESALSQTYQNLQIIIIDDGSTDGTQEYLRTQSDPRVEHYMMEENSHISCATNYGLTKVKGEYLAILDSDDIWHADKIEKQVAYLQAYPEHKACFNWVNIIDDDGRIVNEELSDIQKLFAVSTQTQEYWLRHFFFEGNCLNNPSSMVETSVIREIGDHNPFYVQGHDFDWWVSFTKRYSFGVIEEPLTDYRRFIHTDRSNTSHISEEANTRFYNEYMQIRYHYFEDMEDELFIRAFQEDFMDPDSRTPEELRIEKAFLISKSVDYDEGHPALSFLKLEELVKDEATRAVLKEKYNICPKDLYKITGESAYNDPYVKQKSRQQQETIARQEAYMQQQAAVITQLQAQIDAINQTKLRKLSNVMHHVRKQS